VRVVVDVRVFGILVETGPLVVWSKVAFGFCFCFDFGCFLLAGLPLRLLLLLLLVVLTTTSSTRIAVSSILFVLFVLFVLLFVHFGTTDLQVHNNALQRPIDVLFLVHFLSAFGTGFACTGFDAARAKGVSLVAHGNGLVLDFVTNRAEQIRVHWLLDEQVRVKAAHECFLSTVLLYN
jgi:hypothetical protein